MRSVWMGHNWSNCKSSNIYCVFWMFLLNRRKVVSGRKLVDTIKPQVNARDIRKIDRVPNAQIRVLH